MKAHAQILALFAVALALRLAQIPGPVEALMRPDSSDYLRLAQSLAEGHYGDREIFRAPGYPAFLWLCQSCCIGMKAIACMQALLDCATIALTMRIARRHLGLDGLLSGWLAAINVSLAAFAVTFLSEGPFTFLLIAATTLLFEALESPDRRREASLVFCAGLAFAAALYLRAAASLYLILPLGLLLARRRALSAALLALVLALAATPWVLRNQRVAGYGGFSSVGDLNLYRYNAAALQARQEGRPFAEVQAEISSRYPDANDPQQLHQGKAKALQRIKTAPLSYAAIHLRSSLRCLPPATGDYLQNCGFMAGEQGTLAIVETQGWIAGIKHYCGGKAGVFAILVLTSLMTIGLYFAAAWGLCSCWNSESRLAGLFLAASAGYFLIIAGPAAHPRFGVPAQPFLILLAALGWQHRPRWMSELKPPSAISAEG